MIRVGSAFDDRWSRKRFSTRTTTTPSWKASTLPDNVATKFGNRKGSRSHPGCTGYAQTFTWACADASCTACDREIVNASQSVCMKPNRHVRENLAGAVVAGKR